ncbi:septation ring formation regulator EzrA [Companilactobacillus sp. DQM5]|uniref:septation ring formation regulator EzrA n=1 Tax=Companilactobacillus sp. DQM5 TaxID=3463359 RepID=UPI0040591ED2
MALNIFIAIVVILILIVVFVWYMSNKNEKDLIEAQDRIDLLKIGNIKKMIDDLQSIQFTGASLKSYQNQIDIYNNIVDNSIPIINSELEEIQEDNSKFKVFSVHSQLKTKFKEIDKVKEEINKANLGLIKLADSTKKNASQSTEYKNKYQEIRKQLLTKSFIYGPTAPKLEEELKQLEVQFSKESELTQKGDHLEAKNLLDSIKKDIDRTDWQMKQIEPLYQKLIDVFPGQLDEIESVYEKMKTQKYDFPKPSIDDGIIEVTDKIADSKEKLAIFDFGAVTEMNKNIAQKIESLYDTLEKEAKAKNEVSKINNSIFDFLQHAHHQNEYLLKDINEIERHFILLNDEKTFVESSKNEIYELIEQYNQYSEEMSTDSVIYSEILKFYQETKKRLTEIEEQQLATHENIQQMINSEKVAKVSVDNFYNSLRNQKREVDQMRLRGLPKEYLDYFKMVSTEIAKLEDQLNETRINIEDISKQSIIVQEDLNNLEQKTKDLISDVKLTEMAIQYSNRYINSDEEVRFASQLSKKLFDQEFDYKRALKVISDGLEKVEPGSIKRLKDTMDA